MAVAVALAFFLASERTGNNNTGRSFGLVASYHGHGWPPRAPVRARGRVSQLATELCASSFIAITNNIFALFIYILAIVFVGCEHT